MAHIALKVDVDTDRGTREGVPRLAEALERLGVQATFLFSVGPDHTGRAIRRVFRKGFLGKVRRTSVARHYGIKTLLYGTLLPGPHIGRRHGALMREIALSGFEVGVHTYDHTRWQDHVAHADELWTRHELMRAYDQFLGIFGEAPHVHGAAGWQLNNFVPGLEAELGFRYTSDVRGTCPFLPVIAGEIGRVPQLPTTLPTLDELMGRADLSDGDAIGTLLRLTRGTTQNHVYTLHAEIEGGEYLQSFLRLLMGWRDQGYLLGDLAQQFTLLDVTRLPLHEIGWSSIEGRAGPLAVQGPRFHASVRSGHTDVR